MSKRKYDSNSTGCIYILRDDSWNSKYIFKIGIISIDSNSLINNIDNSVIIDISNDKLLKRYHTYYIDIKIKNIIISYNYKSSEKLIHNLLKNYRNDSSEIFIGVHPILCDLIVKSVSFILNNEEEDIYIKKKCGINRKKMEISTLEDNINNSCDDSLKVPIDLWNKIQNKMIGVLKESMNIIYKESFDYEEFIFELNNFFVNNYKL